VAGVTGTEHDNMTTATFPATASSVPAARRLVRHSLAGSPATVVDRAALMVSELATNAFRHASTSFTVSVQQLGAAVRVEVTDSGGGEPVLRHPSPTEAGGRGLQIVMALALQWGVEAHDGAGKTVWFTLALGGGGRAGHPRGPGGPYWRWRPARGPGSSPAIRKTGP
jgi:anti-sigma regulatory factor (Ser/Thr protein kinase)